MPAAPAPSTPETLARAVLKTDLGGITPEAEMVIGFTNALSLYIGNQLSMQVDKSIDEEFKKLISNNTNLTEEQVIEFYKQHIPGIEDKLTTLMLQFKKMFLVDVYKKRAEDEQDPEEKQKWEDISLYAQKDMWDQVMERVENLTI